MNPHRTDPELVSPALIRCRAKLVAHCYDGDPTERQFDEDAPMHLDNTYSQATDSIVCDPCYIAIMPFTKSGQALTEEMPEAIEHYRANAEHVRASKDLGKLRRDAEKWRDAATPGYPAHASASACLAMVGVEEQRRREAT
jgi:hypothetical protein